MYFKSLTIMTYMTGYIEKLKWLNDQSSCAIWRKAAMRHQRRLRRNGESNNAAISAIMANVA